MTTYPERIISDQMKLHRGNGTMTTDEIAAETMVRIAQDGWKFLPADISEEVLTKAGITRKQFLNLYSALKER